VVGGCLTAVAIWSLSGLLAPVPAPVRWLAILGAAVLGVLREFQVLRFPLPQNARLIPQRVLQYRPYTGVLQFGFELGTGVRTYVSSSAPYVLVVAVLAGGQGLAVALVAGLGFGVGRGLTAALSNQTGGDAWDAMIMSRLSWVTRTTMIGVLVSLSLLATVSH
jgi:hypothetical protein